MLTWAVLLALGLGSDLDAFIAKRDPAYSFSVKQSAGTKTELELTSQKWQEHTWKHAVLIETPKQLVSEDTAILYITGDRVPTADDPYIKEMSEAAKLPVVCLFDVPNQPLYDEREDALIAVTFGKYMETGDASWPLLFPMTKSAIRTMDAIQEWSKGKIKRFVVAGASKRGWTTWLVGATRDKRVIGIAPMVFDMLKFKEQLAHQKEVIGDYAPAIRDYTESGLVDVLEMPRGKSLMKMVDPASYLSSIKIPVLVILGSNDEFWATDAHNLYWNDIRGPKLMRIVPNAGHNLNGGREAAKSLAYFARAIVGNIPGGLPLANASRNRVGSETWWAESSNRNFRESKWFNQGKGSGPYTASFELTNYSFDGLTAAFTTPVTVKKN
jgi:PhoPQ-activated pathogenicity-related protein